MKLRLSLYTIFILASLNCFGQKTSNPFNPDSINFLNQHPEFSKDRIHFLPFRSINSIALTSPNTFYLKGGQFYVDGISQYNDFTFIDGMQVEDGNDFPLLAIGNYEHFRFGQPVYYGNTNSGSIGIGTINEAENLQFTFDGSNTLFTSINDYRLELMASGPVKFSKKKKSPLRLPVSFTLASTFRSVNDPIPSWEEKYQVKPEVYEDLIEYPLRFTNISPGNAFFSSEFITAERIEELGHHQYTGRESLNTFINLNVLTRGLSISIGSYIKYDEGREFDFSNALMNASRNPESLIRNFDNYLRIGQQVVFDNELKVSYKLLLQYSNYYYQRQDSRHKDRFFDYGYLGKYQTWKMPTYELGSIEVDGVNYDNVSLLNSWDADTSYTFQDLNYNPELSRYTEMIYELYPEPGSINEPFGYWRNEDDLRIRGGLLNGDMPPASYGLWNQPGTMTGYYQRMKEKMRGTFISEIEYKNNTLTFGFEYQNKTERYYMLDANELWARMSGVTNFHIMELDLNSPVPVYDDQGYFQDTVLFYRSYQEQSQFDFDKNLRQKLGLPQDGLEFILTDSYDMVNNTIDYYDKNGVMHTIQVDEELYSIDMFNPFHLIARGTVNYAGYDFSGNKTTAKDDAYGFFTNSHIDPYSPSYFSVFLSDKYIWKFIDADIGVRLDYFNANQPVLKDPYLLMPAYTIGEIDELQGMQVFQPSEVGDDYIVYVDNSYNPSKIMGYRNGDSWYDEAGQMVEDPSILDAGSGVSPYLKYPDIDWAYSPEWEPDMTFKSFEAVVNILPQVNLTGRTKYGNVYFNYNTFSRNPFIYNRFRPDQYWNINLDHNIIENPDLKPTLTQKLILGFSPRILKNLYANICYFGINHEKLLVIERLTGAWPRTYTTVRNYNRNIQYDNFTLAFNYRTSMASGLFAGSSYTKSFISEFDRDLMLIPDYIINSYLTFNFGSNGDFILPGDKLLYGLFSNVNIGLFHQYRSGTPLQKIAIPIQEHFYTPDYNIINLRIEKGVHLKQYDLSIRVYALVENLFNSKNLFYVYPVSGEPNDDGYLSSPEYQLEINEQTNPESYRLMYQLKLNNPANYGTPRLFRAGLIINL